MSLLDTIRTTMRQVVGSGALADAGYVRAITSAPTVQVTRTYGSWQATFGLVTARQTVDVAEPRTGRLMRQDRATLTMTDEITLPDGSQWSTDQTELWAIDSVISAAGGTVQYAIVRDTTERGQAPRGGGV